MITKITTANANKYRVLFDKATRALRTHDNTGMPTSNPNAGAAIINPENARYLAVELTADTFLAGQHFYKVDNNGVISYQQTSLGDMFDENKEYFVQAAEITSLEEYFSYLEYLQKINPIYTILPVDENIFEIDANARTITVPAEFRANGVSVQDDEISEILYFRIDRFFDMEDLALDEIYIEWRCPANADGEVIEGVSVPWAKDLESDPGHIIFGWPLASELTATPGDITFAVRFFRFGEGQDFGSQVVYSFSTLSNTVTVKPGINLRNTLIQNYNDPYASPKSKELIEARIMNSDADITGIPPVSPVISDVLVAFAENADLNDSESDVYGVRYLPLTEAAAADRKQTKYAEYYVYTTDPRTGEANDAFYRIRATINDLGSLTYAWIKMNEASQIATLQQLGDDTNYNDFVPVVEHEFQPDYVYYKKINDDTFVLYDGELTGDPTALPVDENDPESETYGLYVKCARIVVRSTTEGMDVEDGTQNDKWVIGTYQPRITNTLNRKTARIYGPIVRVEPPIVPEVTVDVEDRGIIGATGESDSIELTVGAKVDAHGYTTFEWYKLNDEDEFELLENDIQEVNWSTREIADRDSQNQPLTCDVISEALTVTEDGYYTCKVNTLSNGESQRVEDNNVIRVTHTAGKVVLDAEQVLALQTRNILIGTEMELTFADNATESRTDEDSYEYQWYRYVADTNIMSVEAAEQLAAQGDYVPSANDVVLTDLSGAIAYGAVNDISVTTVNTSINDTGRYFCIITNTYNGDTATTSTPFFLVQDISEDPNTNEEG